MRTPRPWYRSQTDTWYVCLRGKQIPLAKGKKHQRAAKAAFYRLMAIEPAQFPLGQSSAGAPIRDLSVAVLLDDFLEWVQHNLQSYDWYRNLLEDFAVACGKLTVSELKPLHVTNWIAKKTWGPTTRNKVIGALKQSFNWAVEQGYIDNNPIRVMKRPTPKRRERILTGDERQAILRAARGQPFKNFVTALQETGARPGEIAKVTAREIDLANGVWVLHEHKTARKTGRPRVVYLNPTMLELCRRLIAEHPQGPIFLNSRGRPWTRNAIRMRFRQLRHKLKLKGVVAYCYRHTFATDGLERGIPIATMAELLGHTSTAMLSAHYGHLSQKGAYLRQAVIDATVSTHPDIG